MFHVSDWLPTIFEIVGGKKWHLPNQLDGISQLQYLQFGENDHPSNRMTLFHHFSINNTAAMRLSLDFFAGVFNC